MRIKRSLFVFVSVMFAVMLMSFSAAAQKEVIAVVTDPAQVISDSDEDMLLDRALEMAKRVGFSVIIATTDDIGTPKTDARTVAYADDLYESYCGKDTDGILLLINCDTEYDYISTSGVCINYFSDYRLEQILDSIFDDLVAGKYTNAASTFISKVGYYYEEGMANHQQEILGREVDVYDFFGSFIRLLFFTGFGALIVSVSIYAYFSAQYKLEKPSTKNYMLRDSLYFDQKSDVFLGNVTTRIYSPRSSSSSSSHRSGSSHHSSTHHSSSGGRHGGSGRHR